MMPLFSKSADQNDPHWKLARGSNDGRHVACDSLNVRLQAHGRACYSRKIPGVHEYGYGALRINERKVSRSTRSFDIGILANRLGQRNKTAKCEDHKCGGPEMATSARIRPSFVWSVHSRAIPWKDRTARL